MRYTLNETTHFQNFYLNRETIENFFAMELPLEECLNLFLNEDLPPMSGQDQAEAERFKTELEQAALKRPSSLEQQVCWSRSYDVLARAPSFLYKFCEDHLHQMPRGSPFISDYFCFQCFCWRYFQRCDRCKHVYHYNRLQVYIRGLCYCSLCILEVENPHLGPCNVPKKWRHHMQFNPIVVARPISPTGSLWDTDSEEEDEGVEIARGVITPWRENDAIPSSPIATQQ